MIKQYNIVKKNFFNITEAQRMIKKGKGQNTKTHFCHKKNPHKMTKAQCFKML